MQSNNATYGGTGQIEQQFAITRARAMEARREIAVATTNSVSGFIDRDGRVVQRTAEFTADSMVVSMPLRSALTPALAGRALAGARSGRPGRGSRPCSAPCRRRRSRRPAESAGRDRPVRTATWRQRCR